MKQLVSSLQQRLNRQTLLKGVLIGVISLLGAVCFALFFFVQIVHSKYRVFLEHAHLEHSEFVSIIKSLEPQQHQEPITLLILGTDELENRPGHPQLTDTMLLTKIDPAKAKLVSLPLPRDLWSEPYQTKINALYEYGKEKYPDQPTLFPQEVLEEMTGEPINQVLLISLEQLGTIIDLIGCITIEVETGFIDEQFPRSDVDPAIEQDPAKLYETVEFEAGPQSMNSERALKYIRSRYSSDQAAGNDLARGKRQQQVISAIISQLSNPKIFWHYPQLAGELLALYQAEFNQYLPLEQFLSLVMNLVKAEDSVQFSSAGLPVYPDNESGVIEHPKNLKPYQNQWVYIINDQSSFRSFINTALNQP